MFCIKCGKKAVKGNFCKECFLERNSLVKLKNKVVRARVCECGRYTVKEEWKKPKDMIEEITEQNIEVQKNTEIIKKNIETKEFGNRIYVYLTVKGKIEDISKTEEHEFEIILKKNKCLLCSRKSGNYHEAVLQLRGVPLKEIKKVFGKRDEEYITKIREVKNNKTVNYDILLVDKKVAEKIARALRSFGYDIKTTFKLVSQKKGKKLYRKFYAVRKEWND